MFTRLVITLAALCLPAAAFAQGVAGTWDFRIDDTTIFRFAIEEGEDGEWHGRWSRPASFNSDGNAFARLRGGVETLESSAGYEFDGDVELSFDDPRPGAVPDVFRFAEGDGATLLMTYVGTDFEPYVLVRADDGEPVGGWDANIVYRRMLTPPVARVRVVDDGSAPDRRLGAVDYRLDGLRTVSTARNAPVPAIIEDPVASDAADERLVEDADKQPEESTSLIGDDFLEGLPETP